MSRSVLTALLLVLGPAAALAAPLHALGDIERSVRELVAADSALAASGEFEIVVGRLDPRLRLPRCSEALDARYTRQARTSGARSVEVRCNGSKPWALYVPVTVERYAEVVIATRPLARGQLVQAADLTLARRRVDAAQRDYFTAIDAVAGQLARRAIADGEMLSSRQLSAPRLVRRGDRVLLSAGSGTMSVSMQGEALSDGAAGERIRVRNLSSSRVVEGTVNAAGVVEIATLL